MEYCLRLLIYKEQNMIVLLLVRSREPHILPGMRSAIAFQQYVNLSR